ncbi:hypothetical protein HBH56_016380 [Parastagonospora nodorum]|uniref:Wax synthase domain-containing protein n=1 Tax=Phaeosphaeria nodorum (strain SN15 / ATCC MYA-4574 / FGSC 10173) TaxID=321614 RepID=A0A7U2EXT0_PHANO|nr:hypothetical protein HBH56_016380 [Parastagonospora nodorum]QRC95096.1 hypothetical protein JI435_028250 [Parastagonospora nodorum SN15]KAH3936777.1 hypothetical protein HBH54_018080 [Parastagonospora nodorum]KAH3990409.1 hypothetical protein HBH52_007450 [Parastagonospora nodorum]KAH4134402.1 hypothetical protein HBH45_165070 [Parastagonospora nodorum]
MAFRHCGLVFLQLLLLVSYTEASQATPELERRLNACAIDSKPLAYSTASKLRAKGWVEQPNYRGTFDILWVSLVTIGISTYTMLCLNLPAPKDTYVQLVYRRILWMLLGIIGPEFVLTYAAGQWSRAKWSVIAFRDEHPEWHMRHAFFADMGGFVLHTHDGTVFPVNALQLHWLVRHNYIEFPNITRREVWDKSKQDTFTKVITAFQVGYLVIQCSARAAQRLTITTLELNALAIVVCSLMTSFAWLHKPADVSTPVHIYTTKTVADMIGNLEWDLTPLDHVDPNGPAYSVNVQPFMGMPVLPEERPIQRIPNDRFPTNPYGAQEYLLCFATLLFTAIHVAGWHFDFPTNTERLLWRISSLLLFGITVAFWFFETIASWTRLGRWKTVYLYMFNRQGLQRHRRDMTRKQTLQPQRKMSELPVLWEFITITPMAIIYGIARLYLIGEAFAELRDVNASAYVNVEWTNFVPHI